MAGFADLEKYVTVAFVSSHFSLIMYQIARYVLYRVAGDQILFALLFISGLGSIGLLATNVTPRRASVLGLCVITTFLAVEILNMNLGAFDIFLKMSPTLAVTYASMKKKSEKSLELIAGVMTLNLLLALLFGLLAP